MLSVIVDGLWRQGNKSLAVRLVAENGEALPEWQPGAHIDVHLPCGVIRQYSLTGGCENEGYLICVGRETASRGRSRYIHETLRPGQKLLISAPRNLFALQEAERVLLLAAGIGITPLYAMALALEAAGTTFTLHYYVRQAESAAFARELAQIEHGNCVIHTTSPRTLLAEHIPVATAGLHAWSVARQGLWKKCVTSPRRRAGMKPIFTARRFSPLRLSVAEKPVRSLRSNWPPPASAGRYLQIKPSPRCCRKMAWTSRCPARWGSAVRV